jgi:hypothetical protein
MLAIDRYPWHIQIKVMRNNNHFISYYEEVVAEIDLLKRFEDHNENPINLSKKHADLYTIMSVGPTGAITLPFLTIKRGLGRF